MQRNPYFYFCAALQVYHFGWIDESLSLFKDHSHLRIRLREPNSKGHDAMKSDLNNWMYRVNILRLLFHTIVDNYSLGRYA